MHVTSKLYKVFQVEKQIRGLKSRLTSAERFLAEQDKQLAQIDAKKANIDGLLRQAVVAGKGAEGEMARLDARMDVIKKQMDTAQTNKEYKAFLTEHNTLKVERDKHETQALESMGRADEYRRQSAEFDAQRAEREKMRGVASADRDARGAEIKGRVDELTAERATLAADVPPDVMVTFDKLLNSRGEEAMAVIEEQDRKRHEFNCASCMMSVTIEAVSALLSSGKLTRCTSCGCVLFVDKELTEAMQPAAKK